MRGASVAAALVALALGACSGEGVPDPDGRPAPNPLREIDDLMARRARALVRRDARGLAATVSGSRLRAADRRRLRRLRGVPLARARYLIDDVTLDGDRARVGALEAYRLGGLPGSEFTVRRSYRAVRRDGRWRLASERRGREAQPWEIARLRALRGRHSLVLAPAGVDARREGVAAALDRAYRAVDRALAERLADRYLVVVAATGRQARRLAARIAGIETLVAVADSDVREERGTRRPSEVLSQRLVLIWPRYRPLGREGRHRILTHELTHLATAATTSGLTPSWLVEGLALHVSGDRRVDEAARLVDAVVVQGVEGPAARRAHTSLSLTALSGPEAIARLRGPAQAAAYAYSSAAAFYLADKYGRRRLLRLYRTFGDDDLPGAPGSQVTDAAVRRVLGISLLRLERNLRTWILARALVAPDAP